MISIIIPVFNCFEYTELCIESIRKNTKDYELIIVDNGSTDKTKEWFYGQKTGEIEENCYPIVDGTVIVLNQNLGYSKANNIGLKHTNGDHVCFLNNDTIVTPNWDKLLISHLNSGIDIIGPCSNFVAGMQKRNIGIYENNTELADRALEFSNNEMGKTTETNWVIGFCMVMKKTLLDSIGSFDEQFRIGNSEDIDLCMRAKQKGFTVGIAEDTYIHHFGSASFKEMQQNGTEDYNSLLVENSNKLVIKWGNEYNFSQI